MNLTQYVKYASLAQNYIAVGLNTNQRILVQNDIFKCKERFESAHATYFCFFTYARTGYISRRFNGRLDASCELYS